MTTAGIRDLKNSLSRYLRRVERGERIVVTDRGRVVAELVPPGGDRSAASSRYDAMIAGGLIRPPIEPGSPLADFPHLDLPTGTAASLIDEDRGRA